MKTMCNYFESLASAIQSFVRLNVLIFLTLFFTQIDARAEVLMDSCTESACYGQTYYASATLSPAMSATGTDITIKTLFGGMSGFESAQLYASVVGGGSVLNVTLTDFSGQYLPDDTVLGIITLNDGESERTFLVATDGGVLTVILDNI